MFAGSPLYHDNVDLRITNCTIYSAKIVYDLNDKKFYRNVQNLKRYNIFYR